MIVTKFDRNPMKYVEEETNCQKEEERKKLDICALCMVFFQQTM